MIQTCLAPIKSEDAWKLFFLIGLAAGSFLLNQFDPSLFNYEIQTSMPEMIIGGALVGFGTRLGSGCTSGHGVCGLPRLALRSLVAVLVFMATAIITVYIRQHQV